MLTALILGTVGSLHCMGMCGPIVLALPQNALHGKLQYLISRLAYNGGRVITYILLGLVFGSIGHLISLAGLQSVLSVTLGILVLLTLFTPLSRSVNLIAESEIWRRSIGSLFRKKSFSALLGIGLLNGFLPCGLVYTALAGAAASGDSLYGGAFMAVFGLGTIPALLVLSIIGRLGNFNRQKFISKALPVTAFILGVLLILRGLSLGIPYISPDLTMNANGLFIPHCH